MARDTASMVDRHLTNMDRPVRLWSVNPFGATTINIHRHTGAAMRDKLVPWVPAIFCATLGLIVVVGNLAITVISNGSNSHGSEVVYYAFLPMCFYLVGEYLRRLQQENRELRERLVELAAVRGTENQAG
jgi:hypothetical protein